MAVLGASGSEALGQTGPPAGGTVVVILMTGFNPGANPGLQILQGKIQAAFASGGNPQLNSQVFAYTDLAGATNLIASVPSIGKIVLIGHSWGAAATFDLAANHIGPLGLTADLAIAIDWVSPASPFSPTTPPVPTEIATALNFHQVSTAFLEPVPSSQIIGAKRNLNMEVLYNDTSLTHTSIDNDLRVHERIIDRILELVNGTVYPGTDEDLDTLCRVDALVNPCQPGAGIAVAGILSDTPVLSVSAGDWISLRAISPEGVFTAGATGIVGEIYPTISPPTPLVPGIASSLTLNSMFAISPAGGFQLFPFAFSPMPGNGFDTALCWPAGAQGFSVILQTIVVDPAANNGLFASSRGIELRGI